MTEEMKMTELKEVLLKFTHLSENDPISITRMYRTTDDNPTFTLHITTLNKKISDELIEILRKQIGNCKIIKQHITSEVTLLHHCCNVFIKFNEPLPTFTEGRGLFDLLVDFRHGFRVIEKVNSLVKSLYIKFKREERSETINAVIQGNFFSPLKSELDTSNYIAGECNTSDEVEHLIKMLTAGSGIRLNDLHTIREEMLKMTGFSEKTNLDLVYNRQLLKEKDIHLELLNEDALKGYTGKPIRIESIAVRNKLKLQIDVRTKDTDKLLKLVKYMHENYLFDTTVIQMNTTDKYLLVTKISEYIYYYIYIGGNPFGVDFDKNFYSLLTNLLEKKPVLSHFNENIIGTILDRESKENSME